MSNSSAGTKRFPPEPLTTIGAQDLLQKGYSLAGVLRRQGKLERIFGFLKWRRRFVVISDLCVYIYKDETSDRSITTFSLASYNIVSRDETRGIGRWGFKLVPHMGTQKMHLHKFACVSEAERKNWMKKLKMDMLLAQDMKQPVSEDDWDDYMYLEQSLRNEPQTAVNTLKKERPPIATPSKQNAVEDNQDDYTEIKEVEDDPKKAASKTQSLPSPSATSMPLPAIPSGSTSHTLPIVAPRTRDLSQSTAHFSRESFEFKCTDRDRIQATLSDKPEGTFCVRPSRTETTEVLSVNLDGALKEFKIYFRENKKYSIDNKVDFPTVEKLIEYYLRNNLPKRPHKLVRAYKLTESFYLNDLPGEAPAAR